MINRVGYQMLLSLVRFTMLRGHESSYFRLVIVFKKKQKNFVTSVWFGVLIEKEE